MLRSGRAMRSSWLPARTARNLAVVQHWVLDTRRWICYNIAAGVSCHYFLACMEKRHGGVNMHQSGLFIRQIGMDQYSNYSLYEVRDAREQNHIISILSGPGDDGVYREILEDVAFRRLTKEELSRLNELIKLQEGDADQN
jgi:hypothetical protein